MLGVSSDVGIFKLTALAQSINLEVYGWNCGTCHMASLFTSLPRTETSTFCSEIILQTCQHQLPQALSASTAHRNIITFLQMGPLSREFLCFSCLCRCSSHNLRFITKPLLDKVSSNQQASTSSCMKTALKISRKIFIAETSFWAAITLAS